MLFFRAGCGGVGVGGWGGCRGGGKRLILDWFYNCRPFDLYTAPTQTGNQKGAQHHRYCPDTRMPRPFFFFFLAADLFVAPLLQTVLLSRSAYIRKDCWLTILFEFCLSFATKKWYFTLEKLRALWLKPAPSLAPFWDWQIISRRSKKVWLMVFY